MATTHNYKYSGNDHDDYSQRTTSSPTILACYNYIYNYNENSVEKMLGCRCNNKSFITTTAATATSTPNTPGPK